MCTIVVKEDGQPNTRLDGESAVRPIVVNECEVHGKLAGHDASVDLISVSDLKTNKATRIVK